MVRRMIPPAAAPVPLRDLIHGLSGLVGVESVDRLENEIREFFGSGSVFLVSSGKAALVLILDALSSLRARRKVLVPAYTCYSVPSAIVKSGLEIVPCDVDPRTLDFEYAQLERLADDKTLCVLSTHLFGIPGDLERTRRICVEKGVSLVEDAAQAMGVLDEGRRLGAIGDVGFFSLGRGKNLTCGSGGIIITRSEEIAGALRGPYRRLKSESLGESVKTLASLILMDLFMNPSLYWIPDGLPFLGIGETHFHDNIPMFRMNRVKVGVLRNWKYNLEKLNAARFETAEFYKKRLGLNRNISIYSGARPYLRFPIYLKDEQSKIDICKHYRHLGISPMYPAPINTIGEIANLFDRSIYPNAVKISRTLITLPTHPYVDGKLREKVCSAIDHKIDAVYL